MKILDEEGKEIKESDVDYSKGYLTKDYETVAYHEPVPETPMEGHNVVRSVVFSDGSVYETTGENDEHIDSECNFIPFGEYADKEIQQINIEYVVDKEYVPATEGWYENEEVQRYVLYTEEELKERAESEKMMLQQQQREQEQRDEYEKLLQDVKSLTEALESIAPSTF